MKKAIFVIIASVLCVASCICGMFGQAEATCVASANSVYDNSVIVNSTDWKNDVTTRIYWTGETDVSQSSNEYVYKNGFDFKKFVLVSADGTVRKYSSHYIGSGYEYYFGGYYNGKYDYKIVVPESNAVFRIVQPRYSSPIVQIIEKTIINDRFNKNLYNSDIVDTANVVINLNSQSTANYKDNNMSITKAEGKLTLNTTVVPDTAMQVDYNIIASDDVGEVVIKFNRLLTFIVDGEIYQSYDVPEGAILSRGETI